MMMRVAGNSTTKAALVFSIHKDGGAGPWVPRWRLVDLDEIVAALATISAGVTFRVMD